MHIIEWEISDLRNWNFFSPEWLGNLLDVTYWSHEKRAPTAERVAQWPTYVSGRKSLLPVEFSIGIHYWGSRAAVDRINYWSLIKEKTVYEICPLGNKRNNYINSVFAKTKKMNRAKVRQTKEKQQWTSNALDLKPWARPSETEKRESRVSNTNLRKRKLSCSGTCRTTFFLKDCVYCCNWLTAETNRVKSPNRITLFNGEGSCIIGLVHFWKENWFFF